MTNMSHDMKSTLNKLGFELYTVQKDSMLCKRILFCTGKFCAVANEFCAVADKLYSSLNADELHYDIDYS